MAFEVIVTKVFRDWYEHLSEPEQNSVERVVNLLISAGPALSHPYSSAINGSKFSHMRELRIQHKGDPIASFTPSTQIARPYFSSVATRRAKVAGTTE